MFQGYIENPVKHLTLSILRKQLTVNYFRRKLQLNKVLNAPKTNETLTISFEELQNTLKKKQIYVFLTKRNAMKTKM